MARTKSTNPGVSAPEKSAANLGFEAKLWLAADKLRNNMDAAEYKIELNLQMNATLEAMARARLVS